MDRNTERMQRILTGASLDDVGVRLVASPKCRGGTITRKC